MFHGLVFIDGEWVSFGLHVPSPQWTEEFLTRQRTYGSQNVGYVFWFFNNQVSDMAAIQSRVQDEIRLANEVQQQWDAGGLRNADDGDGLNVSRGIALLRKATA